MEEKSDIVVLLSESTEQKRVGPIGREQVYQWPPPSLDPIQDSQLLLEVDRCASDAGGIVSKEAKNSVEQDTNPHYGGFATIYTAVDIVAITWPYAVAGAVTAAGVANFFNNALSAVERWKNLRGERRVSVSYKGRSVDIEQGDGVDDIIRKIQALVDSRDR